MSVIKKLKVIIIGAGAAGISAATRLLEHGINDVAILEAKDRIGGRINSVDFDGDIIDLGAQWCHGEENNIVYNLVKDLNILNSSKFSYSSYKFYKSNGKEIEKHISDKLVQIAFGIWNDESLKDSEESLGEFFITRYNSEVKREFGDNEKILNLASDLLENFHKFILIYDAASTWFDISAKGSICYQECDGDKYLHWGTHGFKIILDILMKKIPGSENVLSVNENIYLNKEVTKIIWKNQVIQTGNVQVHCSDNTIYNADHVIITLPLGVLKQNYSCLFSPELPLIKQNAIFGLGFGSSLKIFLKFSSKWWDDSFEGISLVWTESDYDNVKNEFPDGCCNDGKLWLQDVWGFYPIDSHENILLAWIAGYHISEIEQLPKDVILDGCLYLLKKFSGIKYNIPRPNDTIWSVWSSDKYFNGCYSYSSLKSELLNVSAEDLAQPIVVDNKLLLLFAGEATHPTFYSTVHGAIESGFREADRIINIYKNTIGMQKCKL